MSSPEAAPRNAAALAEASELARLQYAWGHCYEIGRDGAWWVAERRDDRAAIRRASPGNLLTGIQDDHAAMPVPLAFRLPEPSLEVTGARSRRARARKQAAGRPARTAGRTAVRQRLDGLPG